MSPMRWVDVVILAQPAILSGLNEELEATEFAVQGCLRTQFEVAILAQMLLEWAVLLSFSEVIDLRLFCPSKL